MNYCGKEELCAASTVAIPRLVALVRTRTRTRKGDCSTDYSKLHLTM